MPSHPLKKLKRFRLRKLPNYTRFLLKQCRLAPQRWFIALRCLFMRRTLQQYNGRIVVYTAIVGGKDTLKEFRKTPGVDYVCFTDKMNLNSRTWSLRPLARSFDTPRLTARYHKIMAHEILPEYKYSFWLDGSLIPRVDVRYIVHKFLTDHLAALLKHPERDCVYEEAGQCIRVGKGNPEAIRKQMQKYREQGFQAKSGLSATTFVLRQHTDERIKEAMLDWWKEVRTHSIRDQLSFDYVANKNGIDYCAIPANLYSNAYVSIIPHQHDQ